MGTCLLHWLPLLLAEITALMLLRVLLLLLLMMIGNRIAGIMLQPMR